MVRSFIYLLLLIVVFLSGMILGVDREQSSMNSDVQKIEDVAEINETEHLVDMGQANSEHVINMDTPVHFTQKAATFLEAGVKGFYEVVVEILYQVSTLFF